ncbi:MAG TPA: hypothetical protein VM845_03715, partial [Burkholderiaceae bacterium]|nr:hypothetical protein [Burkholderiaceae bacterium]
MPNPSKTRKPKVGRPRAATKKPIASKAAAHRSGRTAKTVSTSKAVSPVATAKDDTKQARMITMLRTDTGASIDLMAQWATEKRSRRRAKLGATGQTEKAAYRAAPHGAGLTAHLPWCPSTAGLAGGKG